MVHGMQFSPLTAPGFSHWLPEPMKQAVDQHSSILPAKTKLVFSLDHPTYEYTYVVGNCY